MFFGGCAIQFPEVMSELVPTKWRLTPQQASETFTAFSRRRWTHATAQDSCMGSRSYPDKKGGSSCTRKGIAVRNGVAECRPTIGPDDMATVVIGATAKTFCYQVTARRQ